MELRIDHYSYAQTRIPGCQPLLLCSAVPRPGFSPLGHPFGVLIDSQSSGTMLASAPATAGSGGSVPDTPHSDPPSSSGSAQAVIEITDTSTPQPAGVCHGSTEGSHPRTSSVATTSTAKPPTTEPDPVKNPNLSLGHKNHGWLVQWDLPRENSVRLRADICSPWHVRKKTACSEKTLPLQNMISC
eukprot:scaffold22945_cov32-Phaeocystis_antarctica.AAC.1